MAKFGGLVRSESSMSVLPALGSPSSGESKPAVGVLSRAALGPPSAESVVDFTATLCELSLDAFDAAAFRRAVAQRLGLPRSSISLAEARAGSVIARIRAVADGGTLDAARKLARRLRTPDWVLVEPATWGACAISLVKIIVLKDPSDKSKPPAAVSASKTAPAPARARARSASAAAASAASASARRSSATSGASRSSSRPRPPSPSSNSSG